MAWVIHQVLGARTRLARFDGDRLRVGRGANADLRLDDPAVELEHALFERRGDQVRVMDLGSVTGTYLDGQPVADARLADGDEVGVGGWLLAVRRIAPGEPVFLHLRPVAAESRPGDGVVADGGAPAAERVDYAGSYRLRRGLWNKAFLGLAAAVVAVVGLAAVALTRQLSAFQPGDLTAVHAQVVGTNDCAACHAPWRGAADAGCESCHAVGAESPARPHHPSVLPAAERCTACHLEHQGADGLMAVADRQCLDCHRDLARAATDASGVRVATLTAFAVDHPDFAPPAEDPSRLAFGHARHLKEGLLSPTGRVTLACADCHSPQAPDPAGPAGPESGELGPVSFEAHCQRCHDLTFDAVFARDVTAPHGDPEIVRGALYRAYQDEQRRAGAILSARERRQVLAAERRLYETNCVDCHRVDFGGERLAAETLPRVEEPGIPDRWLPRARFTHGPHLSAMAETAGLGCEDCHGGARESSRTADVLLPGIAACTPCHGGGPREGFPHRAASARCLDCHGYHEGDPR
jgi:mono/diheme cytochrome c family protein